MDFAAVAVIGTLLLGYSLVSARLDGGLVTAPVIFAGCGLFVSVTGVVEVDIEGVGTLTNPVVA